SCVFKAARTFFRSSGDRSPKQIRGSFNELFEVSTRPHLKGTLETRISDFVPSGNRVKFWQSRPRMLSAFLPPSFGIFIMLLSVRLPRDVVLTWKKQTDFGVSESSSITSSWNSNTST